MQDLGFWVKDWDSKNIRKPLGQLSEGMTLDADMSCVYFLWIGGLLSIVSAPEAAALFLLRFQVEGVSFLLLCVDSCFSYSHVGLLRISSLFQ